MATDDTIDDTVSDCLEAYPYLVEVFEDTELDDFKDELKNLGYILDEGYDGVPMTSVEGDSTIIYRVLIPMDMKDDAYDILSDLDFVYGVWKDPLAEPIDELPERAHIDP